MFSFWLQNICSPTNSIHLADVEVPVKNHNDPPVAADEHSQTVTLSSASLGLNNGHRIKTFLLLFRVQCPVKSGSNLTSGSPMCNGEIKSSGNLSLAVTSSLLALGYDKNYTSTV